MYFACSPPNRDTLSSELIASFQKVSLAFGGLLQLYAIVDARFESPLARWARNHGVSIGEKSSLAAIKNHLPFVIPLSEAPSAREVSRLIGAAKRSPMISFVASRSDATKLVRDLQALLVAHRPMTVCAGRCVSPIRECSPCFLANLPMRRAAMCSRLTSTHGGGLGAMGSSMLFLIPQPQNPQRRQIGISN